MNIKDIVKLPESSRLFILCAMLARYQIATRAEFHQMRGAPNDYQVCVLLHDAVSFYIRDLHDGRHDPLDHHAR